MLKISVSMDFLLHTRSPRINRVNRPVNYLIFLTSPQYIESPFALFRVRQQQALYPLAHLVFPLPVASDAAVVCPVRRSRVVLALGSQRAADGRERGCLP